MRIDLFLWYTRIFKSRTIASNSCKKGHIKIDGKSVKRLSGSAAKKKCEQLGFKIGSTEFPKCLRILTQ